MRIEESTINFIRTWAYQSNQGIKSESVRRTILNWMEFDFDEDVQLTGYKIEGQERPKNLPFGTYIWSPTKKVWFVSIDIGAFLLADIMLAGRHVEPIFSERSISMGDWSKARFLKSITDSDPVL